MVGIFLIFIFNCLISTILAVRFSKCELVNELRRQGFPEYIMSDMICLIGESSGFRTHVIRGPDQDGSYDFGLFQINDRRWCNTGSHPGKACNVRCVDLLLDDITLAASCAKTILRLGGLRAWSVWEKFCLGYKFPDHNCPETYDELYKFNKK